MALFPTDRQAPELDCEVVQVKLNELRLHHPRQWGACWLALKLWEQLELDRFWQPRLPVSRQGTKWLEVLKTQVCYQLIDPGSEWRLHRLWYEHSAMQDLLGSATRVLSDDTLYRCLDKLLAHKRAFFSFLRQALTRDALLLKLGAAKKEAGRAYHLVEIQLPDPNQPVTPETFTFSLRRDKLRTVRRREGRYLLRSNLPNEDPATLWQYYIRLTEIEQAFKELKHDLAIRPIYHQTDKCIEAHIFIAFIVYCLHVTLKQRTRSCAPGLTPRAVLEKFATMQMVDVHLPTTDGGQLVLPRYTQPDSDHQLLFQQLKLNLPAQPLPRICV